MVRPKSRRLRFFDKEFPVKKLFRNNGLSIVLGTFFVLFLAGQTIAGRLDYNKERKQQNLAPLDFPHYFASAHFFEATMENWESEFLQMAAYVFLTVFLYQKGSSESKDPDRKAPQDDDPREKRTKQGVPWPVQRGGWVLKLYEHSLGLAFAFLFFVSISGHAISGARLYSEEQIASGEAPVTTMDYIRTPRFWFESLQNWQSEFLAIGSMVVLSIFLRQRGSPESKPVAARMWQTGDEE
jgi:hypothetical protein